MWLKVHDVYVLLIKSLVEQSNIRSKLAVEDDDIQFLLEMIYDSSFPESQVRLSLYLTLSFVCLIKVLSQHIARVDTPIWHFVEK